MSDPPDEPQLIPSSVPVYAGPAAQHFPGPSTKLQAKTIGHNIRERRLQAGLSQADLLRLIGRTHVSWLSRIENGHQLISLPILAEIAHALNVEVDQLLRS